jgi:hypothetical protein
MIVIFSWARRIPVCHHLEIVNGWHAEDFKIQSLSAEDNGGTSYFGRIRLRMEGGQESENAKNWHLHQFQSGKHGRLLPNGYGD